MDCKGYSFFLYLAREPATDELHITQEMKS